MDPRGHDKVMHQAAHELSDIFCDSFQAAGTAYLATKKLSEVDKVSIIATALLDLAAYFSTFSGLSAKTAIEQFSSFAHASEKRRFAGGLSPESVSKLIKSAKLKVTAGGKLDGA